MPPAYPNVSDAGLSTATNITKSHSERPRFEFEVSLDKSRDF